MSPSRRYLLDSDRRGAEDLAQHFAALVASSDDAIISKDLNGTILSWNAGAEQIFGYLAPEIIGKPVTILIPLDRHSEESMILSRIRAGERIEHYETVRRRKDGTLLDVSLTVSPIKDSHGRIVAASKIARDITERKRNQAQIALLARETEHRAKNLLATVQATVQLSQADTPQGLKQAIEGRIRALANVHNLFAQSRWAGADLRTLIAQELSPYGGQEAARAQIEGPNVMLEPEAAQAMAVTMHELATNAAKYGALSVAKGQVRVDWSCTAQSPLVIHWTETGGPPVTPPKGRGFGTRVIESMVHTQCKGGLRFDWRPQGLVCEIVLPAGIGHVAAALSA